FCERDEAEIDRPASPYSILPSVARLSGLLQEAGLTLIGGKTIRIARALLVTAGSGGSTRK
ncbi:MAG: hypothetical protein ACP5CD_04875, partial [Thermovirgaceae bacterium]